MSDKEEKVGVMQNQMASSANHDNNLLTKQRLEDTFALAENLLNRDYVSCFREYEIVPAESNNVLSLQGTRFSRILRLVYNKNENRQADLLNVYNALHVSGGKLIMLLRADEIGVELYLGTQSTTMKTGDEACSRTLTRALAGNFPGTRMESLKSGQIEDLKNSLGKASKEGMPVFAASVTGIPGKRVKDDNVDTAFVQGLEKLADAMRGEKYTLLIIADPVSSDGLATIRAGYENLYSRLAPFKNSTLSYGQNESKSVADTISETVTEGFTDTVSQTTSVTLNSSKNRGYSHTSGNNYGVSFILNCGKNNSSTENSGETFGKGISVAQGITNARMENKAVANGITNTKTGGSSQNYEIQLENRTVRSLLERIDKQLKRLDECQSLGVWNMAAYVLADDPEIAKVAASTYQALVRGDASGLEATEVTSWSKEQMPRLLDSLRKWQHPVLKVKTDSLQVSPASLVSSRELVTAAGLPEHSLPGMPVYAFARFGREVVRQKQADGWQLKLGKIYNMGQEEKTDVDLSGNELSAHVFVTGSTGSGKSNAVYRMLHELDKKSIPWCVIEPAKGEYKEVFASFHDVNVYGTNPLCMPLLKLNPFSFPREVHVLEHIDRLIELFNVCWPMYAAMPAVLKKAVEDAYSRAGWDLSVSENKYGSIYPSFSDLLKSLQDIIEQLDFSDEVRSNYRGALLTRVESLTYGLTGQIFSGKELPMDKLFDECTIIDLSRMPGAETKSLLMGMIVMKLQEWRMALGGRNRNLRHVTVLEEAHHLLRQRQATQAGEGGNLGEKSVEMLADAIAEMRTYGEGFVIADQAPGLLDLSVIRNTNTKIILRLQSEDDCELVGRAAGLDEEQIKELVNLPVGVAAVKQNNWQEPVLCKVEAVEEQDDKYEYTREKKIETMEDETKRLKICMIKCMLGNMAGIEVRYIPADIIRRVRESGLPAGLKVRLINVIKQRDEGKVESFADLSETVTLLILGEKYNWPKAENESVEEWNQRILQWSGVKDLGLPDTLYPLILQCLIRSYYYKGGSCQNIYANWVQHMKGGQ